MLVVGAGVTGASIAYHAACRGLAVTLIDRDLPGMGATQHSFGWIGRSTDSGPAAELRQLARGDYFSAPEDSTVDNASSVEPQLISAPDRVRFGGDDGSVEPVALAESLVEAAIRLGAKVVVGQPAVSLVCADGAVVGVQTPTQTFTATHTVIAAGTDSSVLCATVGAHLPVHGSPAVMVRLRTQPGLVRHIVANDSIEVRQLPDGTLLMPLDYCGQTTQRELNDTAEEARAELLRTFDAPTSVHVVGTTIGWRRCPPTENRSLVPCQGSPDCTWR